MGGRALAGGAEQKWSSERLQGQLAALTDQFAAANEVLSAVGRSAGDPDTVLTTIVESACRLCRSQAAQLYLFEDGYYRLSKAVGMSAESIRYITEHPIPMDRGTLIGRVGLDRTTQQIADVLADPDYSRQDLQRVAGFRTTMGAPMLVDDEVVGALAVWRNEVSPFDQREQDLVTAFAGQAAMAVNSVKLVQQLEARGAELARKVGELEALREVGEAVNSSLDVSKVLSTIAKHAVRISATDGGSIMEYDEDERCFLVRSVYQTDPSVIERLRATRIHLDETLVGRAAKLGRPLAVPDLGTAELDPHLAGPVRRRAGVRWSPYRCCGRDRSSARWWSAASGRGSSRRRRSTLLEMFADQSTLALLNAQLYRELKQRSAELEVASRHKSEFLASMSHELRTPLNAVLGFSEVLLERMFGDLNERQEEYLRDIHGSGKHLLELLNEILDLSKVEAGRMELEYSTFPLRRLLDNTASMLRERATLHGIDLRVEVGPGIDEVYADELRLKQVVLNLMTNAVKFTGDGGSVVVRATRSGAEVAHRGHRHRSRRTAGGPGADLRVVPAGRSRSVAGGGHRARADVVAADRRAARRPDVAGERGRRRQHVRILACAAGRTRTGRTRPGPVGDVVVIEDDRPSLDLITAYLSGAALQVTVGRRRSVRAGRGPAGPAGRRTAGHPAAGHRRVGGAAGVEGRGRRPATSR